MNPLYLHPKMGIGVPKTAIFLSSLIPLSYCYFVNLRTQYAVIEERGSSNN